MTSLAPIRYYRCKSSEDSAALSAYNTQRQHKPIVPWYWQGWPILIKRQPCKSAGAFVCRAPSALERIKQVKAILLAIGLLLLSWVVLAAFEALAELPPIIITGGR